MPTTVITGANSGIGRAAAVQLAAAGHRVFGTMRSLDKGAKLSAAAAERNVEVTPVVVDVTDSESVARGFAQVLDAAGSIDVLVNNAGIGMNATVEDAPLDEAMGVFDANVWGPVRCAKAVLPTMRAQGSGHIVQISSIAGRVGLPAQPIYSGSKWALEGMSESMAHNLAPFGIRVSIIEPGVTRTAILAKNSDMPEGTAYTDAYARMFDMYASGIAANVRPEAVAETIQRCLEAPPGQMRWPVAWGAAGMSSGRQTGRISDTDWVGLGELAPDGAAWCARFGELFGVDVQPM